MFKKKGGSNVLSIFISLIGAFFLSLAVPQTGLGLTLYDDFSSPTINEDNWQQYEYAREIQDGQLRLKTRSTVNTTGLVDNTLLFQNPTSINAVEAKVTPLTYNNPQGAMANIGVLGRFFNDGTGTPGAYKGDILGQVVIGRTGTSPVAMWAIVRFTANDSSQYETVAGGIFDLAPILGTPYTLFIGWNQAAKQFTFRISDGNTTEEKVYTTSLTVAPANMPAKFISNRISNNAGKEASVEAFFDDVKINGSASIYDDFSTDIIDVTKWTTFYDQVRDIDDGELRLGRRTSTADTGAASGIVLEFANPESIKTVQAKVTPLVYYNPNGLDTGLNISGRFYNDGTLNELQGDVIGGVGIGGTGVDPVAAWAIRRLTDPTDSSLTEPVDKGYFSTPITLGTPYTLYVSWDGAMFTFKVNDEVLTYTPTPPTHPPNYPMRRLQARVLDPGGQESVIEAMYDDVMVGFETFRGTVGTQITITDNGFGTKKGTVKVGGKTCTVSAWATDSITCEIKTAMPPPVPYDIVVQPKEPKGVEKITYEGAFTMMAPEITSVDPVSGSAPDEIIISGNYFGTKKGKVYLEYEQSGKLKKKNCKVKSWDMDSIIFFVPKTSKSFPAKEYTLKVANKVGEDSATFTVE